MDKQTIGHNRCGRGAALTLASCFMCATTWAADQAATETSKTEELQEIIVTAQKRSESINDVPMSISAASADTLRSLGVTDTADLGKLVPGFTYAESALQTPVYTIRGVGYYDSSLAATPAVSVYVDQIPLPYPQMTRNAVFDLDRVEVLKGPQGTLFGENSTGGAINYIAAKPTQTFDTGADLTVGRFQQVDGDAFVSGPISDTLSVRFAVGHQDAGDWQRTYTSPSDTRGQKSITEGRLLLDWTPSSALKFELSLSGWIDRSDTQAPQLVAHTSTGPALPAFEAYPVAPDDPRSADWNVGDPKAENDRFYQLALRGDYTLTDQLTLTSLSSFDKLIDSEPVDADGTPYSIDNYTLTGSIRSIFQELRLEERLPNTRLMIGGNYSDDVTPENQLDNVAQSADALNNSVPGNPITYIKFKSDQSVQTIAGFFNVEQNLTDQLSLQGGVRYTSDHRHFTGCLADAGDGALADSFNFLYDVIARPAIGQPGNIFFPPGSCVTVNKTFTPTAPNEQHNQNNVSWRIGPNYKLNPDVLLYANVSKGYKAGTFPVLGGVQASEFTPTRQESVLAYETGVKATVLEHRLEITSAAFYYDYTDKQVLGSVLDPFFGPLQQLVNIPKSRIYGAELGLNAAPIEGLRVSLGGTYIVSQVTSHFENYNPYGTPVDFYHSAFPFTPRWQGIANAEYAIAVHNPWSPFVGGDFTYNSRTVGAFGADVPYNPAQHAGVSGPNAGVVPGEPISSGNFNIPSYGILDLRAGVQSNDRKWRVFVWGRNVTNKYYWTNATFVPADASVRFAGMPATFGATVSYRY